MSDSPPEDGCSRQGKPVPTFPTGLIVWAVVLLVVCIAVLFWKYARQFFDLPKVPLAPLRLRHCSGMPSRPQLNRV